LAAESFASLVPHGLAFHPLQKKHDASDENTGTMFLFSFSRRFKREGVKHRGIRSQNTQPQRNKFMAAVVLKASSGKSGVSLFDDEPMSVWVPSIPQTCEL